MLKDGFILFLVVALIGSILVGGSLFFYLDSKYPEAPLTVTATEPEQTPQVIFVYSCGIPQGVIFATDPLLFSSVEDVITPELEALIRAAVTAERAYNFKGTLSICEPQADLTAHR